VYLYSAHNHRRNTHAKRLLSRWQFYRSLHLAGDNLHVHRHNKSVMHEINNPLNMLVLSPLQMSTCLIPKHKMQRPMKPKFKCTKNVSRFWHIRMETEQAHCAHGMAHIVTDTNFSCKHHGMLSVKIDDWPALVMSSSGFTSQFCKLWTILTNIGQQIRRNILCSMRIHAQLLALLHSPRATYSRKQMDKPVSAR